MTAVWAETAGTCGPPIAEHFPTLLGKPDGPLCLWLFLLCAAAVRRTDVRWTCAVQTDRAGYIVCARQTARRSSRLYDAPGLAATSYIRTSACSCLLTHKSKVIVSVQYDHTVQYDRPNPAAFERHYFDSTTYDLMPDNSSVMLFRNNVQR